MSVDVDTKWFEEVACRLGNIEIETKRIPLTMLQGIFAEVFAHRPGIPQRRDWLLDALSYAERKGVIIFPKKAWDRMGEPPLPKYVTRALEVPIAKIRWWKTHYWHPKLEWAADLPDISDEVGNFLLNVQRGLLEGWFEQEAPLNRRSVELTGKEKRLRQLFMSSLFTEGRLSLELLNITSDIMPLAYEFVGKKPTALVFENKEPFNVALKVLQELPDPPYGILAYGGGGSFEDSVRDFLRIQNSHRYEDHIKKCLEQIHYVGDLDWAGLKIAQRAKLKAQRYGLPSLVPAIGIHQLMLNALTEPRINHPDGFPDDDVKRARIPDSSLVGWLPIDIRNEVLRILNLGNRIPEEMITAQALLSLWTCAE